MTVAPAVLEARNVSKSYGDQVVLKDVNLGILRGEVKVVLGSSGSGKSTLLRCLALLEPVDGGQVALDGEPVGVRRKGQGWAPVRDRELWVHRSQIGMVFQSFNLFPHLTAIENVMIGLTEVRGQKRAEARDNAREFLERVGLGPRMEAFPAELSGGQQQRVAIARALVMKPKAMLFDEPTSALDAELVREVLDVIEGLAQEGMTMLIVTHELSFAQRVADFVCMMDEGVLVEEADPNTFFSTPSHERSRRFLQAIG